ncbi:MAG: RtcB family protein, partial [Infirmifilum sp.]
MVPPLRKITEYLWEIPPTYKHGMRVPGLVIADEVLIAKMKEDLTLEQVANVAFLPGIYKYSIVLPDGHQGYGFPIGGVAAFDSEEGVLSPGGVGYDINCGVRVLRTDLSEQEVRPRLRELAETLFRKVPSGLGSTSGLELSFSELDKVLEEGVSWAISHGYGWKDDPLHIEERGRMEGADANAVSREAKQRGRNQLGTLGSGNHFLEVQKVDKIYDPDIAKVLGIE